MRSKYVTVFVLLLLLFLLFLYPVSALTGARNGLLLWFQTVLPSLLPFAILSNTIIQLNITTYLTTIFYPIFKKIFHVSKNGCFPIIIGMLCGYPLGAKTCADLVKSGRISIQEGQHLLSFCNNASPMFITSYITLTCLGMIDHPYLVLLLIYGSAYLYGFFIGLFNKKALQTNLVKACYSDLIQKKWDKPSIFSVLDNSILDCFELLTKVGGYIILFSLAAQIIHDITWIPFPIKLLLSGILEITTGSNVIQHSDLSYDIKVVLIVSLTSFGGLSSFAQTKSVITDSGLSIQKYLISKIINGLLAALLTIVWLIMH